MSEEKVLAIGTVIEDRYRLVSEGKPQGIGVSFRAYDLQEDHLVDLLIVSTGWDSGQDALARLQRTEKAIRDLSVPGLLPNEHTGLVNGQVYVVRPRSIEGQTLADLLARDEPLDRAEAVELVIRLCEVLAPAHGAGLAHGGLSTHSVLLSKPAAPDGGSATEVMVLDTGLLPALRPRGTAQDQPWGRSPYLSPEQAAGKDVHPASDVYVIGTLLYEMLIGRPPFRATDERVLALQHLHQEPPSLQIMDTSIPKPLTQIVHRALDKEPAARYRNAGQLAHILRAQLGLQPDPGPVRERQLVVPAPPALAAGDTRSSADIYHLEGDKAWNQPSAAVDWVMIALLVAALIAVLGLIPLWTAVYSRYTSGDAGSSLVPDQPRAETTPQPLEGRPQGSLPTSGPELDGQAIVWYNAMLFRLSAADAVWRNSRSKHTRAQREHSEFRSPAYGSG